MRAARVVSVNGAVTTDFISGSVLGREARLQAKETRRCGLSGALHILDHEYLMVRIIAEVMQATRAEKAWQIFLERSLGSCSFNLN